MKKRYYNVLVYRLLCFLIALTLLHESVDVQHTILRSEQTIVAHNDVSVNQVECIGEFILEEWLGMQDVLPEQDSPDDSELTESEQDYDFTPLFVFAPKRLSLQYLLSGNIPFRPEFVSTCVLEILAPPPQPVA